MDVVKCLHCFRSYLTFVQTRSRPVLSPHDRAPRSFMAFIIALLNLPFALLFSLPFFTLGLVLAGPPQSGHVALRATTSYGG